MPALLFGWHSLLDPDTSILPAQRENACPDTLRHCMFYKCVQLLVHFFILYVVARDLLTSGSNLYLSHVRCGLPLMLEHASNSAYRSTHFEALFHIECIILIQLGNGRNDQEQIIAEESDGPHC